MKQTERKVGDVIYIDVDKTAQIYAIGSDGNDVRYYYTYEGVRNFIYEKQCFLLEELHSNLIASAPEMLDALRMAAIRIADLIYKMDGETVKKDGLTNIRGKNGEDELNEIYRLISKAGGEWYDYKSENKNMDWFRKIS